MDYKDSKYLQIEETLKAVGKTTFIDFYYDFKDASITSRDLAHKIFTGNPRAKSDNQNFRIARARHIFEIGQEIQALEIIINSPRVAEEARKKAKEILIAERASKNNSLQFEREHQFISELNSATPYAEHANVEYENTPKPPKLGIDVVAHQYPRSKTVSQRALSKAQYLCECDPQHMTFKRKNCDKNYTEPHHLIPLSVAADFPEIDLDREQNIVSLCSNCHNWLHYGDGIDAILRPLYEQRKDLLKSIGADITYDQLKNYYI